MLGDVDLKVYQFLRFSRGSEVERSAIVKEIGATKALLVYEALIEMKNKGILREMQKTDTENGKKRKSYYYRFERRDSEYEEGLRSP